MSADFSLNPLTIKFGQSCSPGTYTLIVKLSDGNGKNSSSIFDLIISENDSS